MCEGVLLPEKIGDNSLQEFMFNPDLIYSKTVSDWLTILQNTQCYTQNIQNCQPCFLPVEQKAIMVSRNVNLLSYCDYRRKLYLSVPQTFYDITKDEHLAKKLEKVYKHVENVEFYVGINSETEYSFGRTSIFGGTTSQILGLFAFHKVPEFTKLYRQFLRNYDSRIIELVDDFEPDDYINKNIHDTQTANFTFKFKM